MNLFFRLLENIYQCACVTVDMGKHIIPFDHLDTTMAHFLCLDFSFAINENTQSLDREKLDLWLNLVSKQIKQDYANVGHLIPLFTVLEMVLGGLSIANTIKN